MQIVRIETLSKRTDAQIRVYNCPICHHGLRLTVWSQDLLINDPSEEASSIPQVRE
jgi:hypothetical protein